MPKTRAEELVELRKVLDGVRDPAAHLREEKRSMPFSTENHVVAALDFVRQLLGEAEWERQIEFLEEFEIFSNGLMCHMVTVRDQHY